MLKTKITMKTAIKNFFILLILQNAINYLSIIQLVVKNNFKKIGPFHFFVGDGLTRLPGIRIMPLDNPGIPSECPYYRAS